METRTKLDPSRLHTNKDRWRPSSLPISDATLIAARQRYPTGYVAKLYSIPSSKIRHRISYLRVHRQMRIPPLCGYNRKLQKQVALRKHFDGRVLSQWINRHVIRGKHIHSRRLTVPQFAQAAGVSVRSLTNIVSGVYGTVTPQLAEPILKFLNFLEDNRYSGLSRHAIAIDYIFHVRGETIDTWNGKPVTRQWLDKEGAADFLEVTISSIRRWIATGRLPKPVTTTTGSWFAVEDLEEFKKTDPHYQNQDRYESKG